MRICSADRQQRVVVISVRQTRYEALQKETKFYKKRVAREVLAVRRLVALPKNFTKIFEIRRERARDRLQIGATVHQSL
jgi:hypothetical protein